MFTDLSSQRGQSKKNLKTKNCIITILLKKNYHLFLVDAFNCTLEPFTLYTKYFIN